MSCEWTAGLVAAGFGELIRFSHNGDRVSGSPAGHPPSTGVGGPLENASLCRLTGAYACSTENLDRLVDLAEAVPGVYGAQLAGAGLGGCVMILADQAAVGRVKAALSKAYYRPRGMAPAVWRVRSVSGGGLIRP